MNSRTLLIEMCNRLQKDVSLKRRETHTVIYSDYWLDKRYYCEIRMDDVIIVETSFSGLPNYKGEYLEEMVNRRLLQKVFDTAILVIKDNL